MYEVMVHQKILLGVHYCGFVYGTIDVHTFLEDDDHAC